MKDYDYLIESKELLPPLGENKYFAKVKFMYKKIEGENSEEKISHDFGETHGKTEEEAKQKMDEKVTNWINGQ